MDPALQKIRAACEHLEAGRLEETLEALDGIGDGEEKPISESIALTVRGLIFERQGNDDEADECFTEVFRRGVPLSALLRESGRHFKRRGQYRRAFQCFALLRNFEDPAELTVDHFTAALVPRKQRSTGGAPDAVSEFLDELPPAQLARYSPWALRELRNSIGLNLWCLPLLKRALAGELGPDGAAMVFAGMAGKKPGWEVRTLPLASLRDFARSGARIYEELVPSRQVQLPSPRVLRARAQPSVPAETRSVFFAVLDDVIVSSNSNLLIGRDNALLDHQDDELERFPVDLTVDPVVFAATTDSATVLIDESAASAPRLETAFTLVGVNSGAFGHWLLEFLPKVLACLDRPEFDSVPVLIDEDMPPQHREALELLLGPDHPIETLKLGEAVLVKQLWTCSMPYYFSLGYDTPAPVDGEAFADLIERAHRRLDRSPQRSGPKRLYLTRRRSLPRKLVNRGEVEAWFGAHGFEIVDFEKLSFADQMELARGAELMVGPDGSSMLMTLFAGPGTRIGFLDHPYLENSGAYLLICSSLGQHVLTLTGEAVTESPDLTKSDYRIDTEALPEFMDELESMAGVP